MKILFDCTYLRNAHTGVDDYFFGLIGDLLKIDPNNEYIILVDTRYDAYLLTAAIKNAPNYKIKRIYSPLPLQVLYSSFFLPFYLLFRRIDVYHNPYFFGPLLKFVCPSTKIIITVHDMYHRVIPELMNPILNPVFKIFADNAIRLADKVIVISRQTKEDVIKYLNIPEDRLTLIHQALNGLKANIDTDNDYYKAFGLDNEGYILTVGKILPSKGIDDLIKAYAILVNKHQDLNIKLVSAGTHPGDYIKEINALIASLNIKDGMIKILGYVTDENLASLYAHASMVVVPSHYEGFGIPVLEAMRDGKPVIARNASSLIEIVGDAGLLFNDCDELADQIYQLFTDSGLASDFTKRGLERVKFFSGENRARKTLMLYSVKKNGNEI